MQHELQATTQDFWAREWTALKSRRSFLLRLIKAAKPNLLVEHLKDLHSVLQSMIVVAQQSRPHAIESLNAAVDHVRGFPRAAGHAY